MPNSRYVMPEKSPIAAGKGRALSQRGIKQFPGFNDEVTQVMADAGNEAEANRTVDRQGGVHQPPASHFQVGNSSHSNAERDEVGVGA